MPTISAATRWAACARPSKRVALTLLFLPAYSPDLNPIEQVFAKLKSLLRRAEPRSREALWNTIGHSLNRFSPAECQNYLRHCGYGQVM